MSVVDAAIILAAAFAAVVAAIVILVGLKIGMGRSVLIFLSVVVATIGANYAVLIHTHDEQDDCAFGPVSNDRYRQFLSLAKERIRTRSARDFESELSRVFREISRVETSIYPRIAIMHAVLRAFGAEYRNTNGSDVDQGRSDPFLKAATQSPEISFHYLLDVNRVGFFLPWPRYAWIIGVVAGPLYDKPPRPLYPKKRGGLAFIVNFPGIEGFQSRATVESTGSCPPVPNEDLADSFSPTPDR